MFWNRKKSGIVNVKMVITEEKILSNISKVQKLIDPNSKKSIVQLDDDTYFKDLIESIKMYLVEYPNKKTFPESVYHAAYGLVEYATNQFEENTKQIEELIRQREGNIAASTTLKDVLKNVEEKDENWKGYVNESKNQFGEDIISALELIGNAKKKQKGTDEYNAAVKLVKARISNLETNLHIEIDMERIEDRSKALSYIGLEIADALKEIPAPVIKEVKEEVVEQSTVKVENQVLQPTQQAIQEEQQYIEETQIEVPAKKSLWQRIKNSRVGRAVSMVFRIRIVIDNSALPEGRGE